MLYESAGDCRQAVYTSAMTPRPTRGEINTRLAAGLLLCMAAAAVGWLLVQGYFPFRLRSDGIYSGAPANVAGGQVSAARPRLDLPAPAELRRGFVRALRVVDGDTLIVAGESGEERVRLIGVDCDEVSQEHFDSSSAGWLQALWLHEQLKPNAQVRLTFDKERVDRYGRTLAYVHLPGGEMINELLLMEGHAKAMAVAPNTRYARQFSALEQKARQAGKGRWAH